MRRYTSFAISFILFPFFFMTLVLPLVVLFPIELLFRPLLVDPTAKVIVEVCYYLFAYALLLLSAKHLVPRTEPGLSPNTSGQHAGRTTGAVTGSISSGRLALLVLISLASIGLVTILTQQIIIEYAVPVQRFKPEWPVFARIPLLAIVIPLAEELFFRVAYFAYTETNNIRYSGAINVAVFVLWHGNFSTETLLGTSALLIVFGFFVVPLYIRTRSLLVAFGLHASYNLLVGIWELVPNLASIQFFRTVSTPMVVGLALSLIVFLAILTMFPQKRQLR